MREKTYTMKKGNMGPPGGVKPRRSSGPKTPGGGRKKGEKPRGGGGGVEGKRKSSN